MAKIDALFTKFLSFHSLILNLPSPVWLSEKYSPMWRGCWITRRFICCPRSILTGTRYHGWVSVTTTDWDGPMQTTWISIETFPNSLMSLRITFVNWWMVESQKHWRRWRGLKTIRSFSPQIFTEEQSWLRILLTILRDINMASTPLLRMTTPFVIWPRPTPIIIGKCIVIFAVHLRHGCIFFQKSLSFLSPVLCIVFEILKLSQNFSPKLRYFQKKLRKICKNEEKIQQSKIINKIIGKNCIF